MDSPLIIDELNVLQRRFHDACAALDINSSHAIVSLSDVLDESSRELAKHQDFRVWMGTQEPSVWPALRDVWCRTAGACVTLDDNDIEGQRRLCGSLAKFTRNLVAGVPQNQERAYKNEPEIRRLIHYHTSWSAMQDEESFPVTRILAQTLSNMVTTNEELIARLWSTYMSLPEEQVILIRLIMSTDARTVLPALVLVLNCIHGSKERAFMLSTTSIGARVCISILDRMVTMYDAEEVSEDGKAFDLGYEIFVRLFTNGLFPDLYVKLTIEDEVIAPHQTTLLKLLDSYLQSSPDTSETQLPLHIHLAPLLSSAFFALSSYAQSAIRRAVGSMSASPTARTAESGLSQEIPPQELDLMLPKVCEALVLVTQCIVTITLQGEGRHASLGQGDEILQDALNEVRSSDGQGIVESLVELLRLLDVFLPRINFGKPVASPSVPQHATDPSGFSYLKRDLVRLLGILCHGSRVVQDRVRSCGGITVVMNLCVVDERNPYLREHAIFTLRNLLHRNEENQAIVDAIKPTGAWDEEGVLRDSPGAVRR